MSQRKLALLVSLRAVILDVGFVNPPADLLDRELIEWITRSHLSTLVGQLGRETARPSRAVQNASVHVMWRQGEHADVLACQSAPGYCLCELQLLFSLSSAMALNRIES